MNVKMKELPVMERPRERLREFGASQLSNEELLAILLKTGGKEQSAKVLAGQLLHRFHSLKELGGASYQELVKQKGIGSSKACSLLAAVELGKRMSYQLESILEEKIKNAEIVFRYYQDRFQAEYQEKFYTLYLDHQKKVISEKLLFVGTINQSVVHPREIFKEAYCNNASSIICIHNHPSGSLLPSKEDIQTTNQLKEIGALFGIPLVDHIIIGRGQYYSFFENGMI